MKRLLLFFLSLFLAFGVQNVMAENLTTNNIDIVNYDIQDVADNDIIISEQMHNLEITATAGGYQLSDNLLFPDVVNIATYKNQNSEINYIITNTIETSLLRWQYVYNTVNIEIKKLQANHVKEAVFNRKICSNYNYWHTIYEKR